MINPTLCCIKLCTKNDGNGTCEINRGLPFNTIEEIEGTLLEESVYEECEKFELDIELLNHNTLQEFVKKYIKLGNDWFSPRMIEEFKEVVNDYHTLRQIIRRVDSVEKLKQLLPDNKRIIDDYAIDFDYGPGTYSVYIENDGLELTDSIDIHLFEDTTPLYLGRISIDNIKEEIERYENYVPHFLKSKKEYEVEVQIEFTEEVRAYETHTVKATSKEDAKNKIKEYYNPTPETTQELFENVDLINSSQNLSSVSGSDRNHKLVDFCYLNRKGD